MTSQIGLYGLGVMGQNYALNVASKGFTISVHNRSAGRVDTTVARAAKEGLSDKVVGFKDAAEFVASLQKPRRVMFLVTAGKAVDETIAMFAALMEEGDIIIDGGNEWFENSTRRAEELKPKGIHYVAMGISGGEEGARNGPSIMPGCPKPAYDALEEILVATAADDGDGGKCVTWLGEIGSGNYVKMVHNGIEYGDMQLISEAYDILRTVGGFTNAELSEVFAEWNTAELDSFLIEITSKILAKKDDACLDWSDSSMVPAQGADMVDLILDATANKGTGKMTVKEGATRGIAAPTIAAALDARFISFMKEERVAAEPILGGLSIPPITNKEQLKTDVRNALYASKICSYAQGMNIIRAASEEFGWNVNLSESARIWKVSRLWTLRAEPACPPPLLRARRARHRTPLTTATTTTTTTSSFPPSLRLLRASPTTPPGWLHHPREVPGQDQGGIRGEPGACVAPRPLLVHGRAQVAHGVVAPRRHPRRLRRHCDPVDVRVARILRPVPPRAPHGEPGASAA